MLTIGGAQLPSPSSLTVMHYDITEGERDASGTMHIELIATKYKIECTWAALTQLQITEILNAISNITFSVGFTDPITGSKKTISAYKGDRSIPILKVIDGVNTYKDFKVNFIEL